MDTPGSHGEIGGIDTERSERSDAVDTACSLLADARRRALLATLVEHEGAAVRFSELVSAVARRTDADRRTVEIELRHSHIPKAADAGIVEYDRRSGDVRYRGHDVVEAIIGG